MPSERVQRRIDRLLDQAEDAADHGDWDEVQRTSQSVLNVDPVNEDARSFLAMAEPHIGIQGPPITSTEPTASDAAPRHDEPTSFASGRYTVSKFLGEGGKKKVFLAHDNTLDRDVAFALIKTEGLDETSRERVRREAQAMGRMGTHPSIMPIYDLGEEPVGNSTQPYMVQPVMVGGDVEGLVQEAAGPLPLDDAMRIATQTAQGLSFAHGKGIVHRDLKPGNVWLDEDGAAKIGDFGLAVATDRSRLTVEKVMVGTVSYMPPEQATGGEVTPRADLYSLGAMLYEMSTGRVPFMGDDDIGIISQHINTPPVAPSWHNNQIPKTLDSLILRLLAKDPAERPSDANEVLAALKAVDLTAVEEREEEKKGSLDSMAGGVFVGRHREMDQLKATFEEVLSGRGRMVMLVGEPGIGKTRTAQELATYAQMRGAKVFWGRSYEGGGEPAHWPWIQAIRTLVADTDSRQLRDNLGSSGPVVADLVSEARLKLPDLPHSNRLENSESNRFRLFDSVTNFLKNTSSSCPTVLMLEDLQWADKPSLMLLEFIARELTNSKLMIVGNYRDVELNRRHPLSVTLGELTRERLFDRVTLRGLQRHDVERFIELAAGISPPAALVDTVHVQTEGNPLFVTETVRLLIQEGDIASGKAIQSGTTSWEIRIPEGVREVIGRRLDRLSKRCDEVLTMAAVVGRQFRFDVLKTLVEDTSENQLLDTMDEALAARIIEELSEEVGLYQFTHALMEETLTSELSANRLVRMHARIAEALEKYYGDHVEEHAEELARHFSEAEVILGGDKAIRYTFAAADRAVSKSAAAAAQPLYNRLVEQLAEHPDKRLRADAFLGAGVCELSTSDDFKTAAEYLVNAYDLYIEIGDKVKAVYAVSLPGQTYGETGILERLESAEKIVENKKDRANILGRLASALSRRTDRRDLDKAEHYFKESISLSREVGDPSLVSWGLGRYGGILDDLNMNFMQGLERCLEGAALARDSGDILALVHCTLHGTELALKNGKPDVARELANECVTKSNESRQNYRIGVSYWYRSFVSLLIGDWESAQSDLKNSLTTSSATPANSAEELTWPIGRVVVSHLIRYELGESERKIELPNVEPIHIATVARCAWQFPGSHWADLLTDWLQQALPKINYPKRTEWSIDVGLAVEAALNQDKNKAEEIFLRLDSDEPYTHTGGVTNWRILGILASTMNRFAAANRYFEQGIEYCRTVGYRPELAWMQADYIDLLLNSDAPSDREKAIELQDEAISIATELGMKPLLERVLAKREILKA